MGELMGFEALAALPEGEPFSLVKVLVIVVLMPPWLYAASWTNKDVRVVHAPELLWSALVLGSGLLGMIIWLLVPWFVVGLVVYLVLAGGAITAYVQTRNKRVGPKARVWTAEHVRLVLTRGKSGTVELVERLKLYDSLGRPVFPPGEKMVAERQAYNLAQTFLHDVVVFRASQADLVAAGERAGVRLTVDGVAQKRPPLDREDADTVIDFVKQLASMDVTDRRRPQNGKVAIEAGAVPLDIMVSTAGTTQGQRMVLKIVQEVARTNVDDLGLPQDQRDRLAGLCDARQGLIIISGPATSGVTSTLYSLLRLQDAFIRQLGSLEANPSVDMENLTQVAYEDQADLPDKLASLLRRDPDMVMVDDCHTPQAAKVIIGAAADKLILLGIKADSSLQALAKWVKLAADSRQQAVGLLRAVANQVLLRKLCPQCREAFRPAKDLLARLNLPAEKIDKFYRPPTKPLTDEKGNPIVCPTCRGTGYYGRTGAFEMLEINDEIRELILSNAPLQRIKAACRRNKMLYLQEQALRKVIEGVTGIEEVIRVSKGKQQ